MRKTASLIVTFLFVLVMAASVVHADPYGPVVVSLPPTGQGDIHRSETPNRTIAIVAPDYTEAEYFMAGSSTVYTYNDPPIRGEIIPLQVDVPYKTRIVVRTPTDPADFTGTLVIEWLNSTANFDIASVWDASAEHFTRQGWAYVGVTNAVNIINFLTSGCPLLGISLFDDQCGTRYA
ncbi:MAG: alpha/beta hydrolase domain-containing protein, partial [Deltaproteobacteria bacterium]